MTLEFTITEPELSTQVRTLKRAEGPGAKAGITEWTVHTGMRQLQVAGS